jgi:hypothetical protein
VHLGQAGKMPFLSSFLNLTAARYSDLGKMFFLDIAERKIHG